MQQAARAVPADLTIIAKKSILGARVVNAQSENLGKIEDLVIDATNSRVIYAILSFGGILGLGDKHFAIPMQALTFDLQEKCAILNVDKDRLKNAPGFDPDNWPNMADRDWGTRIYTHYGYAPYWEDPASGITSPRMQPY